MVILCITLVLLAQHNEENGGASGGDWRRSEREREREKMAVPEKM